MGISESRDADTGALKGSVESVGVLKGRSMSIRGGASKGRHPGKSVCSCWCFRRQVFRVSGHSLGVLESLLVAVGTQAPQVAATGAWVSGSSHRGEGR